MTQPKKRVHPQQIYLMGLLPVGLLIGLTHLIVGSDLVSTISASVLGATFWPVGIIFYLAWLADMGYSLAEMVLKLGFVSLLAFYVVVILGVTISAWFNWLKGA